MRRILILVSCVGLMMGGCSWLQSRPKAKPYPGDPLDEPERRAYDQMRNVTPPIDPEYDPTRH
jgi:hypothetical protein